MFTKLFAALDKFEEGMAKKTLRKPSEIIKLLTTIDHELVVLQSERSGPVGSRTHINRLRRLVQDCLKDLRGDRVMTYSDLRQVSRDQIGPHNKGLKLAVEKGVSGNTVSQTSGSGKGNAEAVAELVTSILGAVGGNSNKGGWANDLETVETLRALLSQLSPEELSKIDPEEFVAKFDLVDVSEISVADLKGLSQTKETSDQLKRVSHSYRKFYTRLPTKLKTPFAAIPFPVVPLFDDISAHMDNGKLERSGFRVNRIGDHFLVLEDQYLLLLDLNKLGIKPVMKVSRDGKLKSVKNPKGETDTASVVGSILDTINQHSPVQYVLASAKIVRNPRNPKIGMLWIIPERNRKQLDNLFRSRIVEWDIPHSED